MLQVPLEWKVILHKTVCFTPNSAAKHTQASYVLNCDLKLMFDCQESTTNHLQPSLKNQGAFIQTINHIKSSHQITTLLTVFGSKFLRVC